LPVRCSRLAAGTDVPDCDDAHRIDRENGKPPPSAFDMTFEQFRLLVKVCVFRQPRRSLWFPSNIRFRRSLVPLRAVAPARYSRRIAPRRTTHPARRASKGLASSGRPAGWCGPGRKSRDPPHFMLIATYCRPRLGGEENVSRACIGFTQPLTAGGFGEGP